MSTVRIDNSFLHDKVFLRKSFLDAKRSYNVLDAFAGTGRIWQEIAKTHTVRVTSIDIKKGKHLTFQGDNMKWLRSLNLSKFDVIDLDAYGMPINQLRYILSQGFAGIVFVTFIVRHLTTISYIMLNDLGYPTHMIRKIPTLFFRNGFDKFKQWLTLHGIKAISYISYSDSCTNKYYVAFEAAGHYLQVHR